ncbi:MAG: hypothetical protein V4629_06600 [Pseudomonadota bacterium]
MSELTEKVSKKLSSQYEQLNDNWEKIVKASRGLAFRVKSQSEKQLKELIEAGEKIESSNKSILEEIRASVSAPLTDVKGSANKARLATLGLLSRVIENGERYFGELVELGDKSSDRSKNQSQNRPNNKPKNSAHKAA